MCKECYVACIAHTNNIRDFECPLCRAVVIRVHRNIEFDSIREDSLRSGCALFTGACFAASGLLAFLYAFFLSGS